MKSECNEYQKKIAALFLGDLTKEETEALEAHIAVCPHCCAERESYDRTFQQLSFIGEEEVPHHFFLHGKERLSNPWQLFGQMQWQWRAVVAAMAGFLLLLGIAAISHLQIRSNADGWAVSFGRNDMDASALKKDILEAVERRSQEARVAWIEQVRNESLRAQADNARRQQLQLSTALARMDSKLSERILRSEGQARAETQATVAGLYRIMAEQRVRDLEAVNLRFESIDAHNAIEAQQTNEILSTLLQVADLKFQ